jgi:hypothetical protein
VIEIIEAKFSQVGLYVSDINQPEKAKECATASMSMPVDFHPELTRVFHRELTRL